MRFIFYNFKLKRDLDRLKVLHWSHFALLVLALLSEFHYDYIGFFETMFKLILTLLFYRIIYKTKKGLYYSYWTFSTFLLVYLLTGFFQSMFLFSEQVLFSCYLLALVVLFLEQYMLSSPIYFPRVHWWEYDFRYKGDLKVKAFHDENEYDARLTDLRRGAGCVVLFQNLRIGDIVNIKTQSDIKELTLKAEVMSKREYTMGRGITYGVKFHFDDESLRRDFDEFTRHWKVERSIRRKMKFQLKAET